MQEKFSFALVYNVFSWNCSNSCYHSWVCVKYYLFKKASKRGERVNNWLLLTEQEVCMGHSWPRSWVQTERREVCTLDRGEDSPIQTNQARLIKCLLYGEQEQFNSFLCNWLVLTDILLANGDELNLILLDFACFYPPYFLSQHAFWHFRK